MENQTRARTKSIQMMKKLYLPQKKRKGLPIHYACIAGNKAALKKLISTLPRKALEIKDYLGRTPLILTVSCNQLDCCAVLLKAGATVDNTDNAGQTALHVAASKGLHQFVKLLLSYKASVMQRDYFGATALHMASVHSNVKGLTMILKQIKPGEIDVQDSSSKTSLHWSAAYACNQNIKLLLAQGANTCIPDNSGKTPLHWAVANSDPEALNCVKILLKKEPSLINWQDYEGRSPLHIAVNCGSEEILYFLASHENCQMDILDNSFCTPLHWAAKRGSSEKADILLKKRASHFSMDDNGATPLHYAAHNDYGETVKVFASKSYITYEPDHFGRTPLMWAAIRNAEQSLSILVSETVTLSYADRNGVTALHVAAICGNATAVELLVNAGIFVDVKDKYGMTPFLRACEFGRSKAAQTLLKLGANMYETDINLCSALHWCAKGGHAYLTEILLKRGADFNIQDSLRMTPLHYASITGDFINCTCVLVESGADINRTNNEGKTPLHIAVLNERKGVVRYLCEHDADINAMFLMSSDCVWITPYDCAIIKSSYEIGVLLKAYGGFRAQDIKAYAAKIIQTWFRRVKRSNHSNIEKKELHNLSIVQAARSPVNSLSSSVENHIFIPNLPTSYYSFKKCQDLFHVCHGCFHRVTCDHMCQQHRNHLFATEKASPFKRASTQTICVPLSDLPATILNSVKNGDFFHIDSGYFHKATCNYNNEKYSPLEKTVKVYYKRMNKQKAARIIQQAWKRYALKKRFARVRHEAETFFSNKDELSINKKIMQLKISEFYLELNR